MEKEIEIGDLVVVPGEDMRELCKKTIIACDVPVITKSQIKENETDECFFVSVSRYKLLLKTLENFLTKGVKI